MTTSHIRQQFDVEPYDIYTISGKDRDGEEVVAFLVTAAQTGVRQLFPLESRKPGFGTPERDLVTAALSASGTAVFAVPQGDFSVEARVVGVEEGSRKIPSYLRLVEPDEEAVSKGPSAPEIKGRPRVREETRVMRVVDSQARIAALDAQRVRHDLTVAIDMNTFRSLSEVQQAEFYKLFNHYSDVEFVFQVQSKPGDPAVDRLETDLRDFAKQYSNVDVRTNPSSFHFEGRTVLQVTKENVEGFYRNDVEKELRGSNRYHSVGYGSNFEEAGLIIFALQLLTGGEERALKNHKYFYEIPMQWIPMIDAILNSFVYIGTSA